MESDGDSAKKGCEVSQPFLTEMLNRLFFQNIDNIGLLDFV